MFFMAELDCESDPAVAAKGELDIEGYAAHEDDLSRELAIRDVTLGTNIGTTLTAVLAASAVTGALAVAALEIALVHLFFNVFAVVAIFGIPVLRPLPLVGARWLSDLAAKRRLVAIAWVGGTFVLLPLVFVLLSLGG